MEDYSVFNNKLVAVDQIRLGVQNIIEVLWPAIQDHLGEGVQKCGLVLRGDVTNYSALWGPAGSHLWIQEHTVRVH